MDKARVIECYKIDEQVYQSTCTVLGLKNPKTLTGEQLNQFDMVRGWMDNKECSTFNEAKERFKKEQTNKPQDLAEEIVKGFSPISDGSADRTLEEISGILKQADSKVKQAVLQSFYRRVIEGSQSPEYQEKLRKACEGEIIDADFFSMFALTATVPALPESQPSQP
jgi:hypothetical protein